MHHLIAVSPTQRPKSDSHLSHSACSDSSRSVMATSCEHSSPLPLPRNYLTVTAKQDLVVEVARVAAFADSPFVMV
jgi:hypothetical protein